MWNDLNRYNQEGYSAPTEWPKCEDYNNLDSFEIDMMKAIGRERSRREWVEEQRLEHLDNLDALRVGIFNYIGNSRFEVE